MKPHDRSRGRAGERGRILIMVLITVLTLSAFWFIALSVTGSELQAVGGRKSAAQQLFDAEAGVNSAMENFTVLYNTLAGDVTTDMATFAPTDPATGQVVAQVTLRPIQDENAALAQSYGLPVDRHVRPSGPHEIKRKYALNAVSGGKEIQVGIYLTLPEDE